MAVIPYLFVAIFMFMPSSPQHLLKSEKIEVKDNDKILKQNVNFIPKRKLSNPFDSIETLKMLTKRRRTRWKPSSISSRRSLRITKRVLILALQTFVSIIEGFLVINIINYKMII